MSLPDLNRQLVLEGVTRVADGAGGFSESWVALGIHWAEVMARTGRERSGSAVPVSLMNYRITVRATPVGSASRPVAGQRFVDGARIYDIQAVSETDGMGRYLTCFAIEEVSP
jgi:head-tail adaptor